MDPRVAVLDPAIPLPEPGGGDPPLQISPMPLMSRPENPKIVETHCPCGHICGGKGKADLWGKGRGRYKEHIEGSHAHGRESKWDDIILTRVVARDNCKAEPPRRRLVAVILPPLP